MKNTVVWVAGVVLVVSFVFPNGVPLPTPKPTPLPAPTPAVKQDAKIVALLSGADGADKRRIASVYTGMKAVLQRDAGVRVNTLEKLAEFQANTLQLAIETPGKYPGLDDAIEAVFKQELGTTDNVAVTAEVTQNLIRACDILIASTK